MDSKEPNFELFRDFLMTETRFSQLPKIKGEAEAEKMFDLTLRDAKNRYRRLKKLMD